MTDFEIRHFHLFCGLGGGAKGMNKGRVTVGNLRAKFRCIGGIDVDPSCIRDFHRLAGVPGTVLDLFERDQYTAFHGKEPPVDWRPAMPEDILRAAGYEHPHIAFLSPPCKGLSGLLSETKSKSAKYTALNQLTLRGIWLTLEAYKDDPIPLIILENVPRIANRGRRLLDQISALLRSYGYKVAETTHDCGELGGLAQSRKRFLLVARHEEKIPTYLYEPHKRPLKAVGDILSRMPLPGDPAAGPMHRIPNLQWKTWVRLAMVEAGKDWRSLNRLAVVDGYLRDYAILPAAGWNDDVLGVMPWTATSGTITGKSSPTCGRFAVADPRAADGFSKYQVAAFDGHCNTVLSGSTTGQGAYAVADPRYPGQDYRQYGVNSWQEPMGTISGQSKPGGGKYAIADPRLDNPHHKNVFRVVRLDQNAGTITSGHSPTDGAGCVADPRPGYGTNAHCAIMRVTPFDGQTGAVTGAAHVTGSAPSVADPRLPGWSREACGHSREGAYGVTAWDGISAPVTARGNIDNSRCAIADPRPGLDRGKGDAYLTSGFYGVKAWDEPSGAISASACHDNGFFSVADVRLPEPSQNLACVIIAEDGTWHRPFTTLELAALQSLIDPEEYLELDGHADAKWRERIGNAVPPNAAQAIGEAMGQIILLTALGETFHMSANPIWVQPMIAALMVAQ